MKIIARAHPVLLYFMASLSTFTETMYSAALPNITDHLNVYGGLAQFSTTAYYIGFSLGILTLGRVSDLFGRRPVILFGITLYILISLLISSVNSIEIFIILRFFQAYGASVGSVIIQAIARDSYKGWELSYIYASVAVIASIAPSIGSCIGGYIVEYSNWRYVFRFLSLYTSVLLSLYFIFLPETNSYVGVARDNKFIQIFKIVIKDKVLMSYAFIVGAFNGICFGFFIQAPFIFIDRLEMYPSNYGKLFILLSIANLCGALLSRYLIKKYVNTLKIKIAGIMLSFVGCTMLYFFDFFVPNPTSKIIAVAGIFIPMSIHLIGHSFLVPMLLRHALEDYHKVTGTAGSIFGSLYYFITSCVSMIISSFYSDKITNFATLFMILMITCLILFALSMKWRRETIVPSELH